MTNNYEDFSDRESSHTYTFHSENEPSARPYESPIDQQPKRKKKKGMSAAKKFGLCLATAAVFGLTAGSAYAGISNISNKAITEESKAASDSKAPSALPDKANNAAAPADQTQSDAVFNFGSKESLNSGSTVEDVALTGAAMSTADVAESIMPSMVAITNVSVQEVQNFYGFFFGQEMPHQLQESTSMGTGVIIGQDNDYLYIATNEHVVADSKSLSVAFIDENAAAAEIVNEDASNDLAVIKVALSDLSSDTCSSIRVASSGSSSDLRVGDQVIAIGNALGYGQSVSQGIVSALNRSMDGGTGVYAEGLIQTDAAINPGNSGGALLNEAGQLIGINSAKYASTTIEGMGYAIPIDKAYPIFEAMIAGTYGTEESAASVEVLGDACLGISCITVTEEMAQFYHLPQGIYIKEISAGAGAEAAGLASGDIITAINGEALATVDDLTLFLNGCEAGQTVTVTASRNTNGKYQSRDFSVTLSSRASLS